MSSRNRYLSAEQRGWAARIPEATTKARGTAGATVGERLAAARATLSSVPLDIEYLEIASAVDLKPLPPSTSFAEIASPRLFVAARAGSTRLIDNVDLS